MGNLFCPPSDVSDNWSTKLKERSQREDHEYRYWLSKIEKAKSRFVEDVLKDAPYHIKNNKNIVIAAVQKDRFALKFASPQLQYDREVVMAASSPSSIITIHQDRRRRLFQFSRFNGKGVRNIDTTTTITEPILRLPIPVIECHRIEWTAPRSDHIKNNKDKLIATLYGLKFASPSLKNDKQFVLPFVQEDGFALEYVSAPLQNDKQVVLTAVQNDGLALEYASPSLQNDKQVVLAAVQNDGFALKFVAPELFKDKDFALLAVKQNPDKIKYVHEDLKRDPDILITASMFDGDHQDAVARRQQSTNTRKIVLSTRFSLDKSSHSEATKFTALFKKSLYIQKKEDFIVYAPNAFDKNTCDPGWTRFDWPCRGTANTCKYKNNLTPEGHPTDDCCWRYSFRSQLQEAKDTQGFMLQLVETEPSVEHGKVKDARLGMGQRIELDMANKIGTKVFQVYRPERYDGVERCFEALHINAVTNEISRWYDNQCQDKSVTIICPTLRWLNKEKSPSIKMAERKCKCPYRGIDAF